MSDTASDILRFVEENDVKFIRLAFCDLFGVQKNVAIMAGELPRAFEQGITFDASAVPGFEGTNGDLLLRPDGATLSILPWRPSHERVMRLFCDIQKPGGTPFEEDGRGILKAAVRRAADMGYACRVGTACEFYLFQTDEAGRPTAQPADRGGYGDIAPLDRGENVRREICLMLETMNMRPESSHHELGPGQNEIDFRFSDALSAADHFLTFKSLVKSVAAQHGLYASFLPKPLPDNSGNGLHIHLSIAQGGKNLFQTGKTHSAAAESFMQGILKRVPDITAFLNPLTNSYRRLGSFGAPRTVTWSHQNRAQLIRVPASTGDYNRMELRSADPACNPYLSFALLLHAGLDGIEQEMPLTPPCNGNPYESDIAAPVRVLPSTLEEALDAAEASDFVKKVLPGSVRGKYMAAKRAEAAACGASEDAHRWEMDAFFPVI